MLLKFRNMKVWCEPLNATKSSLNIFEKDTAIICFSAPLRGYSHNHPFPFLYS